MKVIPLILGQWNLSVLRAVMKELLGNDLSTRSKSMTEPLVVLSKLRSGLVDEETLIRQSEGVQLHFHFGFLIIAPFDTCVHYLTKVRAANEFYYNTKGSVVLTSATLEQWRNILIAGLRPEIEPELRLVLKEVLFYFEANGFSSVFHKYTKNNDGKPLYLIERK